MSESEKEPSEMTLPSASANTRCCAVDEDFSATSVSSACLSKSIHSNKVKATQLVDTKRSVSETVEDVGMVRRVVIGRTQ